MPSPFGHALAGILTAWLADLVPRPRPSRADGPDPAPNAGGALGTWGGSWFDRAGDGLTMSCAVLAALPDIDLLFEGHRTVTHSIGAVTLVASAAAVIARSRGGPVLRLAAICAAAYASHLLLDWMAVDQTFPRGLQALWPLNQRFYISGWNVFRQTERQHVFSGAAMRVNVVAVAQELVIFTPLLVAAWLVRVKALARFATEVPCGHHPAQ